MLVSAVLVPFSCVLLSVVTFYVHSVALCVGFVMRGVRGASIILFGGFLRCDSGMKV